MASRLLQHSIAGEKGPLVFFLHGFPDSGALFGKQVEALKATHRCVSLTLPFHGNDNIVDAPLGPSFAQLDVMLENTVENFRKGEEKVNFVCHDWGTVFVYHYERRFPERVSRLVGLDVAPVPPAPKELGFKGVAYVLLYQWYLLAAYLIWHFVPVIGKSVGNFMTTLFCRVAGHPETRNPQRPRVRFVAAQNYCYFNFWLGRLLHEKRPRVADPSRKLPQCPFLFIYGGRKPFHFHPKTLESESGVKVVRFDTGHWVMNDSDRLNAELKQFFKD